MQAKSLSVTERAMSEKDSYCWDFSTGKVLVSTPGTGYAEQYEIGADEFGNPTCSCPQGTKPVCKHRIAFRMDWGGHAPVVSHMPIPVQQFAVAAPKRFESHESFLAARAMDF